MRKFKKYYKENVFEPASSEEVEERKVALLYTKKQELLNAGLTDKNIKELENVNMDYSQIYVAASKDGHLIKVADEEGYVLFVDNEIALYLDDGGPGGFMFTMGNSRGMGNLHNWIDGFMP